MSASPQHPFFKSHEDETSMVLLNFDRENASDNLEGGDLEKEGEALHNIGPDELEESLLGQSQDQVRRRSLLEWMDY